MNELNYPIVLNNFLLSVNQVGSTSRISQKECSLEDYVGKITAIFCPYIQQNISEGNFIKIQNKVKGILKEIKETK